MTPLRRLSLTDQAESELRTAIRSGRFDQTLPGIRSLARALGVNHLTVSEAVSRLVRDGTLISGGPRRRFTVADRASGDGSGTPPDPPRKVLFLTSDPPGQMQPVALEILARLLLERPQWEVRHRVAGTRDGRPDRRLWESLIKSESPGHLVIYSGRPALAEWAASRGIPAYFLGGDPGSAPVPVIGLELAKMISLVLSRLFKLGHRRICMPICGMPDSFNERQRASTASCFQERGLVFVPKYHVPIVSRQDPDELARVLNGICGIRPPTALLLLNAENFITASCILQDRGLRIPKDTSIVLLTREQALDWHFPPLAHFEFPVPMVVKTIVKWIESPSGDPRRRISLPMKLIEAESIAPPPPGA